MRRWLYILRDVIFGCHFRRRTSSERECWRVYKLIFNKTGRQNAASRAAPTGLFVPRLTRAIRSRRLASRPSLRQMCLYKRLIGTSVWFTFPS